MNIQSYEKIITIIGKNQNRDKLVYHLMYKYIMTNILSFVTVIGKCNPYLEYISDNIYIRYDECVLKKYIENVERMYLEKGEIDKNILIVDTNEIDLTSDNWRYILNNYKHFKTTIIIIFDEIKEINSKIIRNYTDITYIFKPLDEKEYLKKIYETFGKYKINYEMFNSYYKEYICENYIFAITNKEQIYHKLYIKELYTPKYIINTPNIYDVNVTNREICRISDILKRV